MPHPVKVLAIRFVRPGIASELRLLLNDMISPSWLVLCPSEPFFRHSPSSVALRFLVRESHIDAGLFG